MFSVRALVCSLLTIATLLAAGVALAGPAPFAPIPKDKPQNGFHIEGVKLGNINNSGTGANDGSGYKLYPRQAPYTTRLVRGRTYTIELTCGNYSGGEGWWGVWLDAYQDGAWNYRHRIYGAFPMIFVENLEKMGQAANVAPGSTTSITFKVPSDAWAATGQTYLRVRFQDWKSGAPPYHDGITPDSPGSLSWTYGEVEDYPVEIADEVSVYNNEMLTATEGAAFTGNFRANYGAQPVTWSMTNAPAWLTLNAATGAVSGTPPANSGGIYEISATAMDANQVSDTKKVRLVVEAGPYSLPYSCKFNAGDKASFSHTVGADSRFCIRDKDTMLPMLGASGPMLVLDAQPGDRPWSVTQAIADDPAQWPGDPARDGSYVWAVNPNGATKLDIQFDYCINKGGGGTGSSFYNNLVFDWSADNGQSWTTESDSRAFTNGVYRTDTNREFFIAVLSANNIPASTPAVLCRLRWMVKTSTEDFQPCWIAIDSILVTAPGGGGGGGGGGGSAQPPMISSAATLPGATEGQPYTFTATATGGTQPFTWSVSGAPSWLSMNATTGELSGTPPSGAAGGYSFSLIVTDIVPRTATQPVTLTVAAGGGTPGALAITTPSNLPDAMEAQPYSVTLQATGGTLPYTWSAAGLPGWLALASTGVLSGTPPAGSAGTIGINIALTDGQPQTVASQFTLVINQQGAGTALVITTASLTTATETIAYSATLAAQGGTMPYTWSLATGSAGLPSGMALSPVGTLTGAPAAGSAGNYALVFRVNDNAGAVQTKAMTLTVAPFTGQSGTGQGGNAGLGLGGGGGGCAVESGSTGWAMLAFAAMTLVALAAVRRARA